MPISCDLFNVDISNQTPYCVLKNGETYIDAEWNKDYIINTSNNRQTIDVEV